jgi:hypothetical protein
MLSHFRFRGETGVAIERSQVNARGQAAGSRHRHRPNRYAEASRPCGHTQCNVRTVSACRSMYWRPTGSRGSHKPVASDASSLHSAATTTVSCALGRPRLAVVRCSAALGPHSAAAWPLRQATLYVVGECGRFIYKLTWEELVLTLDSRLSCDWGYLPEAQQQDIRAVQEAWRPMSPTLLSRWSRVRVTTFPKCHCLYATLWLSSSLIIAVLSVTSGGIRPMIVA